MHKMRLFKRWDHVMFCHPLQVEVALARYESLKRVCPIPRNGKTGAPAWQTCRPPRLPRRSRWGGCWGQRMPPAAGACAAPPPPRRATPGVSSAPVRGGVATAWRGVEVHDIRLDRNFQSVPRVGSWAASLHGCTAPAYRRATGPTSGWWNSCCATSTPTRSALESSWSTWRNGCVRGCELCCPAAAIAR